jgi:hypothetical protein
MLRRNRYTYSVDYTLGVVILSPRTSISVLWTLLLRYIQYCCYCNNYLCCYLCFAYKLVLYVVLVQQAFVVVVGLGSPAHNTQKIQTLCAQRGEIRCSRCFFSSSCRDTVRISRRLSSSCCSSWLNDVFRCSSILRFVSSFVLKTNGKSHRRSSCSVLTPRHARRCRANNRFRVDNQNTTLYNVLDISANSYVIY